jgi:hypothetical protein
MSQLCLDHFIMDKVNSQNISTRWIENLALEELNTEESGIINIEGHLNPQKALEESSINFMEDLKELFEIYATKFNEFRSNQSGTNQIKVFKISNTINDFMLFRNSLKLVVARKSDDIISIGFLSNSGGLFPARLNYEDSPASGIHQIKANIGPFNEIRWEFSGEKVEVHALVKHYLTEFIKHSAR